MELFTPSLFHINMDLRMIQNTLPDICLHILLHIRKDYLSFDRKQCTYQESLSMINKAQDNLCIDANLGLLPY